MDTDTYSHPDVVTYSNAHFVSVHLNYWDDQKFPQSFDVPGTPSSVILTADGELVAKTKTYQISGDYLQWMTECRARAPRLLELASAVAKDPLNFTAVGELADLYYQNGVVHKAREQGIQVIEGVPPKAEVSADERKWCAKAAVHQIEMAVHNMRGEKVDIKAMRRWAQIARDMDPDGKLGVQDEAYAFEVLVLQLQALFDQAIKTGREACEKYPKGDWGDLLRHALALSLWMKSDETKQEAIKLWEEIPKLYPQAPYAWKAEYHLDWARKQLAGKK